MTANLFDLVARDWPGHLRASDGWRVAPCRRREVHDLVAEHHYARGSGAISVYCHGLFDPDDRYVGGALWLTAPLPVGRSVSPDNQQGVLTLSRLVVVAGMPTNSASFLLGRSMKLIDRTRWPVLVTYADTALGHTGAIYKATNWTEIGPVAAGDTWRHSVTGEQRGRRHVDTWLASEMVKAGFEKVPAAPKIKFVHTARRAA